jgi:ABC-type phosphate transport system ATPase subunit
LNLIGSQVVQILNPSDYVVVMETGENIYNKKVYLAEYEKYIEETIIYDKEYHIVMSIMRNITYDINYKTQKEELCKNTIEIADAVIEKQMRIAQEIASLLGETVAETKVALSNLKGKLIDE